MKQAKDKERLDKVLANSGFGTRKEVRHFIRSKIVTVNGEVVTDFDAHVNVSSDVIAVSGAPVTVQKHIYLMMNKQDGYVCSSVGGFHATVYDQLKEEHRHKFLGGEISTIGRLDLDTEGLLIFTTDGSLNHRLTSPKWRIPKVYLVYLRDSVNKENQKDYATKLANGVHIAADGKDPESDCLPAEIEWLDENTLTHSSTGLPPKAACHLTIYEGKFHEVKRLFAALGNEVVYLKRVAINGLHLDNSLEVGTYRELTEEELKLLDVNEQTGE